MQEKVNAGQREKDRNCSADGTAAKDRTFLLHRLFCCVMIGKALKY